MKRCLLALAFLLAAGSAGAELKVTGAEPRPTAEGSDAAASADITLNGCLRINGVEKAGAGFRLPLSGWGERKYADVRVLSKSLHDHILKTLETKTVEEPAAKCAPGAIPFVVGTVRRLSSSGRAANVEVIFGGELSVTFGVGRARRVQFPSHKLDDGRIRDDFGLLDASLKAKVEAAILKKFEATP